MGPSTVPLLPLLLILTSANVPSQTVPNFSDRKIKTRRSDPASSEVKTWYLKGAKQRREYLRDKPYTVTFASISRCDERKRIDLNDGATLYAELPIVDWSERRKRARLLPSSEMTGADVTITANSIDTGEQRPQGTYAARHVKITITMESTPGAVMHSSVEERDGWYIDLPGLLCQRSTQGIGYLYASLRPTHRHDHIHFKRLGTAPAGFPLTEITTRTEEGKTTVSKLELLEFSEAALDDTLFQVPRGYSPALSTPHGGYDMTKPETLAIACKCTGQS